jgi:hypothetical protein
VPQKKGVKPEVGRRAVLLAADDSPDRARLRVDKRVGVSDRRRAAQRVTHEQRCELA